MVPLNLEPFSQKCCNRCKRYVPKSEYHKDSAARDGLASKCKSCMSLKNKAYHEKHKERRNEQNRQWYEANREHDNLESKKYKLASKFGLSIEQYQSMMAEQDNRCAICGGSFSQDNDACIDHDHKGNFVRDILCRRCNTGIGMFQDDPDKLAKAIAYLARWSQ